MSNSEAKLHLCLAQGIFEITGSELFVTQQIENFKESILKTIHALDSQVKITTTSNVNIIPSTEKSDNLNGNPSVNQITPLFQRVLHIEGTDVRIIKKVPGANNAQKTANTALVYLWGKKSVGIDSVSYQEIRELCQQQGCLDQSNFSSHMKHMKENIIVDGKKGSSVQTCKLTIPGIEKAEQLLRDLNGE